MAQVVSAIAVLGPGKTGLVIGYRVLNLNGTTYSAFTTTGVAETSVLGTYRVANGVAVPDAGGYIVFGTVATDYAEAAVDGEAALLATIDANVDSILVATGTDIPASIAELNNLSAAEVNAEVVDALATVDKTGYKLASDGLDSVSITAPSGVASNFREMIVQLWRRFFKKATMTSASLATYADDGTTAITTQELSDDGITQTQGESL